MPLWLRHSRQLWPPPRGARAVCELPLAVGFSISRRAQVEALHPRAEIAVVGSHLIRVYESDGLDGVRKSIGELLGR